MQPCVDNNAADATVFSRQCLQGSKTTAQPLMARALVHSNQALCECIDATCVRTQATCRQGPEDLVVCLGDMILQNSKDMFTILDR